MTKPRFRLHSTPSLKWCAEYAASHDLPHDEDVRSNGLGLDLVQDEGLSSSNGYARSSEVEDGNDGYVSVSSTEVRVNGRVNGHAQEKSSSLAVVTQNGFRGNGQIPTEQADEVSARGSDTQANVEYYVPVIGHRVVGVVVSGNSSKLDVDIGAAKLAQLHVQNVLPLDRLSIDQNKWILADDGEGYDGGSVGLPSNAHPYVLYEEEVFAYEPPDPLVVEIGTVLEMEVTGETVSGIALLSSRKAASRVAWDRVVQVVDLLALLLTSFLYCACFVMVR